MPALYETIESASRLNPWLRRSGDTTRIAIADLVHAHGALLCVDGVAFALIQAHEGELNQRLLSFLHSRPKVRIIGRDTADPTQRVSTISFVVEGVSSDKIPPLLDAHKIGIRYGHFYALRLIEDLGLLPQ
ncbi:MAG: aminotransferase class V-fold PLP-dependent enzyme [Nodosilinea sp.]